MDKPKINIPKDINKVKKQIQALEYQLKNDTNDKDRIIHQEALKELKEVLERGF